MRLCLLSPECYPAHHGGIGVEMLAAARLMVSRGHRVDCLTRRYPNHDEALFQAAYAGITTHFIDPDGPAFEEHYSLREAFLLERLFSRLHEAEPFDLLVAPDCRGPAFFILAGRRDGHMAPDIPVALFLQGPLADLLPFEEAPPDAATRVTLAMEDFALAAADAVIAPTDHMRRALAARLGLDPEAMPVLANLLPEAAPGPADPERGDGPWAPTPAPTSRGGAENTADATRIVFAGRLERRKGVDLLVEAFAALSADPRRAGLSLDIYGRDSLWPRYGRMFTDHVAAMGLPPDSLAAIRFRGFRPRREVLEAFASAAVCVVPSRFEPFGMVALEAMGQGAALVLPGPATGLGEVAGPDAARYFDPAEGADGLRRALAGLLDDPLARRELSRKARQRAESLARETPLAVAGFLEDLARTGRRGSRAPGAGLDIRPDGALLAYRRLALVASPMARPEPEPAAAPDYAAPEECILHVAENCTFRCRFCARQTMGARSPGDLTLDAVRRMDALYPDIAAYCAAGLGEPTLNPELPAMAAYLVGRGKYFGLITNGSLTEPLLALPEGIGRVSISLYGASAEDYAQTTGRDAFERVMASHAAIRSRPAPVGFSFVVSRHDLDRLEAVLELCDRLRPAFLELHNFHAYDPSDAAAAGLTLTVRDTEIMERIAELVRGRDYVTSLPAPLDPDRPDFHCPGGLGRVFNLGGRGWINACPRRVPPGPGDPCVEADHDPVNHPALVAARRRLRAGTFPRPQCLACFGRMPGGGARRPFEPPSADAADLLSRLAVCVLFHEKPEQTVACLKSLLPSGVAVHLLDNGSSEAAGQAVADFIAPFPQIRLSVSPENLGVSGGRNLLVAETSAEWLFFLDNDITLATPDWPERLAAHVRADPEVEVLAPLLFNVHEDRAAARLRLSRDGAGVTLQAAEGRRSNFFPGGAALVRRAVFERLGAYDAGMFVGFEDYELCLRGVLSGRPAVVGHADDVVALHDHQPSDRPLDRRAVLSRYDEATHAASHRRFAEKYPGLSFEHVWRPWVAEQVEAILGPADRRLYPASAPARFGASGFVPDSLCPPDSPPGPEYAAALPAACQAAAAETGATRVVVLTGPSGPTPEAFVERGLTLAGPWRVTAAPGAGQRAGRSSGRGVASGSEPGPARDAAPFFDGRDHQDMARLEARLEDAQPFILALDGCLEGLEDPRPLLRLVKRLLLAHPGRRAVVATRGRGAVRTWTTDELADFLYAAGFEASRLPTSPETFLLRCDAAFHDGFLARHDLPPGGIEALLLSPEHADAPRTGGIGTYVLERERLARPGTLGLCLYGQGDFLPGSQSLRANRRITPERLLPPETRAAMPLSDLLLETAQQLLLHYPRLALLEFPDIDGPAASLVAARRAGLLPPGLTVRVTLHGPWPYLEAGNAARLGPEYQPALEREKMAIQGADQVLAPTAFILDLCRRAGYAPRHSRVRRYPFAFPAAPPRPATRPVDTLIFFGKRHPYKGFDLFTRATRRVLRQTEAIRRIVLLGPRLDRMVRENRFFERLGDRVRVIERDLDRASALALIAAEADRALCLLPYKGDNHPCSLLEVVAAGCQVLAARAGGVPEMIPARFHPEVLRDPDPDDLARGILAAAALSGEERQALTRDLLAAMAAEQEAVNAVWREDTTSEAGTVPALEPDEIPETGLVVVCRRFRPRRLKALARALALQSLAPAGIVRLAIGPEGRRAAAFLSRHLPQAATWHVEADSAPAAALDLARPLFRWPLLAVIEAEAVPTRSWLRDLARALARDPEAGAATCHAAMDGPGGAVSRPLGNAGLITGLGENVFGHAASAFRPAAVDAAGGFAGPGGGDPEAWPWSLFFRLRALGLNVAAVPRLDVRPPARRGPFSTTRTACPPDILAALPLAGLSDFDRSRLEMLLALSRDRPAWPPTGGDTDGQAGHVADMEARMAEKDRLILERFAAMQEMAETVARRDARVANQDRLLVERFAAMQEMAEAVARRDARIAAQDRLILERWGAMQEMAEAVARRDARVADQDRLLVERFAAMQEMAEAVAQRDGLLARQLNEIRELERRLAGRASLKTLAGACAPRAVRNAAGTLLARFVEALRRLRNRFRGTG